MATGIRTADDLVRGSTAYLSYLVDWANRLPSLSLQDETRLHGVKVGEIGVIVQDMVLGFCCIGTLASPRVKAIVNPIAALLNAAYGAGVRNIVLIEDHHKPD